MQLQITREALLIHILNYTLPIRWYGFCYFISYLFVRYRLQQVIKRFTIPLEVKYINSLCEFTLLWGIVGGRLWYLILRRLEEGIPIWYHALYLWEGGMAIQGGLVLGFTSGILYLYITKKIQYLPQIMDGILVHMPIAMGIGRIGNYLNQEFMETIPILNIPSCIFAALTEGLLSFILLIPLLARKRYVPYMPSLYFGITYSIVRFINDIFRIDTIYYLYGLQWKLSQYLCFTLLAICSALLYFRAQNKWRNEKSLL